jgi:hypothetical protein
VTSLTAIFGNPDERPVEESDKLLKLYRNRAELKKKFAGLRKEQFALQGRIKQQEGSTARVQQKLDHLEQLLNDPEWVYNIVTHYQLRNLNLRCQSKLEKFAEQLKKQVEQRQHNQLLSGWNDRRAEEAAGIECSIGEQRLQVQMLEDQLTVEQRRLMSMNGFLKFFRRRSVTAIINNLSATIQSVQRAEEELLLQYDEVQNRNPPDTAGLDIPTKRTINFMILAFAQQLYLLFGADDLAGMAKEAAEKSVGAINYGGKEECDVIVSRVVKRVNSFDKATDFADILQQCAKLIAEQAQFQNDDEAIPVSSTISTVFGINDNGVIKTKDANLLGEDYWNLATILSG